VQASANAALGRQVRVTRQKFVYQQGIVWAPAASLPIRLLSRRRSSCGGGLLKWLSIHPADTQCPISGRMSSDGAGTMSPVLLSGYPGPRNHARRRSSVVVATEATLQQTLLTVDRSCVLPDEHWKWPIQISGTVAVVPVYCDARLYGAGDGGSDLSPSLTTLNHTGTQSDSHSLNTPWQRESQIVYARLGLPLCLPPTIPLSV